MTYDTRTAIQQLHELMAEDKPKRGRKKKQKKTVKRAKGDFTASPKFALIQRINQIYKDNGYDKQDTNLEHFSDEDLHKHLNNLQWGLVDWITRKGILPVTPDEIPEEGWCCDKRPLHRIWTNRRICRTRKHYATSLYPGCQFCLEWQEREDDSGSADT